MRAVGSGSSRDLAIVGALLGLIAVPLACAHGSDSNSFGPAGVGGQTGTTGALVVTVTSTGSSEGRGGATSTGASPDGVTVVTSTNTTSSGFTSTTSGFTSTSSGFTSTTSGFTSTTSGFTSPSSVGSSSGGPSSACDGTGDCTLCGECAQCDVCFNQALDCEFDPDCSAILCCIANCPQGNQTCFTDCINSDPAGQQLFTSYYDCLLCSCQEDCAVPAGTCP